MKPMLAICWILLVLPLLPTCSDSHRGVAVHLKTTDRVVVVGTVYLSDEQTSTHFEAHFQGLPPHEPVSMMIRGGSCEAQSASFSKVSDMTSDDAGTIRAQGRLLFHDLEEIVLHSVADGEHVLVLEGETVRACGVIPFLAPSP